MIIGIQFPLSEATRHIEELEAENKQLCAMLADAMKRQLRLSRALSEIAEHGGDLAAAIAKQALKDES